MPTKVVMVVDAVNIVAVAVVAVAVVVVEMQSDEGGVAGAGRRRAVRSRRGLGQGIVSGTLKGGGRGRRRAQF